MEKKLHEVRSREWFSGLVSENGREYIAILRKNSAGCFSRVVFHEACENRGKLVFTPYPRAVIKSVFDIFIVIAHSGRAAAEMAPAQTLPPTRVSD